MPACDNKGCKWGPAGKGSPMSSPGICVLCQDADATAASTGHRRGAVLRRLLAQPSSKQDEWLARVRPDLAAPWRADLAKRAARPQERSRSGQREAAEGESARHCDQAPRPREAAATRPAEGGGTPTDSRAQHTAVEPKAGDDNASHELASRAPPQLHRMLDQGQFRLCSLRALSTTVSSCVAAKFDLFWDATRVYFQALDKVDLDAAWPDAVMRSIVPLRLQTADRLFEIGFDVRMTTDFHKAGWAVQKAAGWNPVVAVAKKGPPPADGGKYPTHALSAVRWDTSTSAIRCWNSWGAEVDPFPSASRKTFVCAFFVDPTILRALPPRRQRQGDSPTSSQLPKPPESPEWSRLVPSWDEVRNFARREKMLRDAAPAP